MKRRRRETEKKRRKEPLSFRRIYSLGITRSRTAVASPIFPALSLIQTDLNRIQFRSGQIAVEKYRERTSQRSLV